MGLALVLAGPRLAELPRLPMPLLAELVSADCWKTSMVALAMFSSREFISCCRRRRSGTQHSTVHCFIWFTVCFFAPKEAAYNVDEAQSRNTAGCNFSSFLGPCQKHHRTVKKQTG